MSKMSNGVITAAVIVSALGYFVDVYDLTLFSVLRSTSLKDLGIDGEALTKTGAFLLNCQMVGMLLGGILWGVLGDKKGRLRVLFGSIILYSIANIANAFVHDVPMYAVWRFIAGVGLAGELGAGITLVAEGLPKDKRGLGTTMVASFGVLGSVGGAMVGSLFPWRIAYIVGGVMGLLLLILRASVHESELFRKVEAKAHIKRGSFVALFTKWRRFRPYISCILIGLPLWYLVGIIVTFAPEVGKVLGIAEPLKAPYAVIAYCITLSLGELVSGLLSQVFKTRRKIMMWYMILLGLTFVAFFTLPMTEAWHAYAMIAVMGFFIGFWVLLLTTTSELFGTNLRATATSTVPNFVRGGVVLMNIAITAIGFATGIKVVAAVTTIVAIIAIFFLPETFTNDLDYQDEIN